MSGRAPQANWRNAIRDSRELDVYETAVAYTISTYLRNGRAYPSLKTIAAGAKVSPRTVDRAVARLERLGFLTVSHSKGRTSNSYLAVIPNCAQLVRSSDGPTAYAGTANSAPQVNQLRTPGTQLRTAGAHESLERSMNALSPNAPNTATAKSGSSRSRINYAQYTGCRLARGSHGEQALPDPLGNDKPPRDWPHRKPSRAEIDAALTLRDEPQERT